MDELKGITLSKYKERYSTITGSNNRFDRRWKIKFFANLPRPCCKSISNGLGVDGKYFIITELRAPCFGLAGDDVTRQRFPNFFWSVRGRAIPPSKRASKCNASGIMRSHKSADIEERWLRTCKWENVLVTWNGTLERLFRVALWRCVIGYFIMQRVKTSHSTILILNLSGQTSFRFLFFFDFGEEWILIFFFFWRCEDIGKKNLFRKRTVFPKYKINFKIY